MNSKEAVVWFRRNLRVHDNSALHAALESGYSIRAVFFEDSLRFPNKTGAKAFQFLAECLKDLSLSLDELKISLTITKGSPLIYFETHQPEMIFTSHQPGWYENIQTNAVSKSFEVKRFHDFTLFNPEELPFLIEKLPNVFTSFRQKVEKNAQVIAPLSNPDFHLTKPLKDWIGGEKSGWNHLSNYLVKDGGIRSYKETRNGMLGFKYSSRLSAWLAHGSLSVRAAWQAILNHEAVFGQNESTYWLRFELLWREFFIWQAHKYGNKLFLRAGLLEVEPMCKPNQMLFDAWRNGKTGDALVDAAMKELWYTGYMGNRARQNAASYLVYKLRQPWTWGAQWFEQLLIDYEPAANYGNWAYIAGVGNDPRGGRDFNTVQQAEWYDSDGAYRKFWQESPDILD